MSRFKSGAYVAPKPPAVTKPAPALTKPSASLSRPGQAQGFLSRGGMDTTGAQAMGSLGFMVVATYVFFLFSRLHDQFTFLHLPIYLQVLGIITMLGASGLRDIVRHRITLYLLGFTCWMFATVPLSVWPMGSLMAIRERWLQWLLLYFLIATAVSTFVQVRKLVFAVTLGTIGGALTTLFRGGDLAGRQIIDNLGRFSDPNDFAQFLLIGMCLLLGLISSTPSGFKKALMFLACVLLFTTFVKTGSRGGMLGFLGVFGAGFLFGSGRQRIVAVMVGVSLTLGILAFAPDSVRLRYLYIFGQGEQQSGNDDRSGESSADARETLLANSLRLTARNPIFGVGTGMFAVAENSQAKDDGFMRGMWHETHNMYTQVSSENGIPGLIFFLAALVGSFRISHKLSRLRESTIPAMRELGQQAFWLRFAMVGFLVTGTFLSVAYSEILVTLVAICVAMDGVARKIGAYSVGLEKVRAAGAPWVSPSPMVGNR